MDIKNVIGRAPITSGVYLMKDKTDKVIYVGKAISLRKRIQSYFRKSKEAFSKTDWLVSEIADIAYLLTNSEAEALILEASLIKKYKPKYNIDLRDDKSYPYVEITEEKFPLVSIVRPNTKKAATRKKRAVKAKYFGPYVNAGLIREALNIIRRIFPFRTCRSFPKRECLDYHIGLCPAPCTKKISVKKCAKNIRNIRLILEGKKDTLYNNLRKDMERYAKEKKFEQAALIRDQIRAIGALYSGSPDINYFKEVEQLQRALHLSRRPECIEAFDISNLMGNQAVGSMVSFLNGKPDKSNYRRFRIRTIEGIDDCKMMAEIIQRRYSRLKKERRLFPDLVVIDGGKGQLSAAKNELDKLEIAIPIISIAKKQEEIYVPRKKTPITLSFHSLGLKLIQRLRDEAHRFAVSYHRTLRTKNTLYGKR